MSFYSYMLSVLMSLVVVFEIHIKLFLRIELNFLVWAFNHKVIQPDLHSVNEVFTCYKYQCIMLIFLRKKMKLYYNDVSDNKNHS